jgi:hypothetical protein
MRIQRFAGPLNKPSDIPVAGVTLADLLGQSGTLADVLAVATLDSEREKLANELLPSDEVRTFRTPPWTWANMGGIEGWVVLRAGNAVMWIVTRMN